MFYSCKILYIYDIEIIYNSPVSVHFNKYTSNTAINSLIIERKYVMTCAAFQYHINKHETT